MRRPLPLAALLPVLLSSVLLSSAPSAFAQALPAPAPPLTLEQVMADPDWIGNAVEDYWWTWDGRAAQYERKREGGIVRDAWQVPVDGSSAPVLVEGAQRATLDASGAIYDATRTRMAFVRNGDVFVRDLRNGALLQVTRSNDQESRPRWGDDGSLVWRVGNDWYRRTPGGAVVQAAEIRAEDPPGTPPDEDALRERQLRLIDTLREDRARRDAAREQHDAWRAADPTRAPAPVYLGDEVQVADSALSPDGRWLLVVTTEAGADTGKAGKMPRYVTESGYEEFEEVRTRVGRNAPLPHTLWVVDMADGEPRKLDFGVLPGASEDPLAGLRAAAGQKPLQGHRAIRVETDGDGTGPAIHWSGDSRQAAVLLRAVDNKDRWIATVGPENATLHARHRLRDNAWINWGFNDFGWLPDNRTLWYLSEESGHSHLYTLDTAGSGGAVQRTRGQWEASRPVLAADGRSFLVLCNRASPVDYEVCEVPLDGGGVRELTALDGVESFVQSPDGSRLLLRYSAD